MLSCSTVHHLWSIGSPSILGCRRGPTAFPWRPQAPNIFWSVASRSPWASSRACAFAPTSAIGRPCDPRHRLCPAPSLLKYRPLRAFLAPSRTSATLGLRDRRPNLAAGLSSLPGLLLRSHLLAIVRPRGRHHEAGEPLRRHCATRQGRGRDGKRITPRDELSANRTAEGKASRGEMVKGDAPCDRRRNV